MARAFLAGPRPCAQPQIGARTKFTVMVPASPRPLHTRPVVPGFAIAGSIRSSSICLRSETRAMMFSGLMVVTLSSELCAVLSDSMRAGQWRKHYRVLACRPHGHTEALLASGQGDDVTSLVNKRDGSLRQQGEIARSIARRTQFGCERRPPHQHVPNCMLFESQAWAQSLSQSRS